MLRVDNVKDEEGFRAVFKVLQPFRRQRKSFWTPSRSILTSDAISAKLPDCYQCRKKNVLKFGKKLIPSSISRLSLGKKFEEVIFEKGWEKVPSRECFTCTRSFFFFFQKKAHVDNSAERNRDRRPNADNKSGVFVMQAKKMQRLITKRSV